ncbi:unnamed protein product [Urochloa decumbens]|uniref:C2H2-type domain-containing protein n=1 Tax=Urochloa decumbens TaxID=240449 RepID=A0ABC8X3Q1_9POAL
MEVSSNLESAIAAMEAYQQQQQSQAGGWSPDDPKTVLTYLTFLEQKIRHLRGIVCSAPRQIVSAELSCIAVQLVSISRSLAATSAGGTATAEDNARSPPPARAASPNEGDSSDASDHDLNAEDDDELERLPPAGSYEVIELGREEILAPHVHTCKVCGKGFKRDANLRMHMRGHGEEYKTPAALAKPGAGAGRDAPLPASSRCLYSCPFVGCKRNREHRSFQPLKTAVCVKNHYRRSHCDKSFTCRRCNVKRFSVLADLRTHEKHCGRDRWVCSCGTSFSRKDKLFGHVAAFDGHAPALPPPQEEDQDHLSAANGIIGTGSDQRPMDNNTEAVSRMANMRSFSGNSMFDGLSCSDIKGPLSPMDLLYSCDLDGFDIFGAPGIEDF